MLAKPIGSGLSEIGSSLRRGGREDLDAVKKVCHHSFDATPQEKVQRGFAK